MIWIRTQLARTQEVLPVTERLHAGFETATPSGHTLRTLVHDGEYSARPCQTSFKWGWLRRGLGAETGFFTETSQKTDTNCARELGDERIGATSGVVA